MKRVIKRALCLLFVLVLCVSVSGCKELDRARAHHATIQEDGSLLLDGKTYLALPYCPEFTPPMGENPETVMITEADVPVLLKDYACESVTRISEDRRILGDVGEYYCLEEDYKTWSMLIEAGFTMVDMQYSYYKYDPQKGTYVYVDYVLTEAQKNAVHHVIASVEPRALDGFAADYAVSMYNTTADRLFSSYFGELFVVDGQYMLAYSQGNTVMLHDVPTELNDVFAEIVRSYIENM